MKVIRWLADIRRAGILRTLRATFPFRREVWERNESLQGWWGVAIFFCSLVLVGRWYHWLRGDIGIFAPAVCTLIISALVWAVPEKRIVTAAVIGIWVVYSLKGVFLDREPRALYITAIGVALILILLLSFLFTGHDDDGWWPKK